MLWVNFTVCCLAAAESVIGQHNCNMASQPTWPGLVCSGQREGLRQGLPAPTGCSKMQRRVGQGWGLAQGPGSGEGLMLSLPASPNDQGRWVFMFRLRPSYFAAELHIPKDSFIFRDLASYFETSKLIPLASCDFLLSNRSRVVEF